MTLAMQATERAILILHKDILKLDLRSVDQGQTLSNLAKLFSRIRVEMATLTDLISGNKTAVDIATGAVVAAKGELVTARVRMEEAGRHEATDDQSDVRTEMPKWWKTLWVNFAELGWRHKSKIAVPAAVAVAAWWHATPSIVDAVKLFLGNS